MGHRGQRHLLILQANVAECVCVWHDCAAITFLVLTPRHQSVCLGADCGITFLPRLLELEVLSQKIAQHLGLSTCFDAVLATCYRGCKRVANTIVELVVALFYYMAT